MAACRSWLIGSGNVTPFALKAFVASGKRAEIGIEMIHFSLLKNTQRE